MSNATRSGFVSWLAPAALGFLLLACGSGSEDQGTDGGSGGFIQLESIAPDHGPIAGGTVVTVTGSGFTALGAEGNSVLVGPSLASVNVISNTEVRITTPAANGAGATDITVINGNGVFSLGNVYTYNSEPEVSSVSPESGVFRGGTTVTVKGSGFQNLEPGANHVFFGANEGSEVQVVSDTELAITSPAGVPFVAHDVVVENANGAGRLVGAYRYTSDAFLAFRNRTTPNIGFEGEVLHVDPVTETSEVVFSGPPEGGRIIAAARLGADIYYVTQVSNLVRLGPDGERTNIGSVVGCTRVGSLTFHQGVLLGFCRQSGQTLGSISLTTAEFTPIGAVTDCCAPNLASNGTSLFKLVEGRLSTINSTTGAVLTTITNTAPRSRGLVFVDGKLFALTRGLSGGGGGNTNFLFEIDPVTGAVKLLGSIGADLHGLVTAF